MCSVFSCIAWWIQKVGSSFFFRFCWSRLLLLDFTGGVLLFLVGFIVALYFMLKSECFGWKKKWNSRLAVMVLVRRINYCFYSIQSILRLQEACFEVAWWAIQFVTGLFLMLIISLIILAIVSFFILQSSKNGRPSYIRESRKIGESCFGFFQKNVEIAES